MRPLRAQNEFGALRTALVHDASNAVDTTMEDLQRLIPADELKDHPESGPSFRDRIIQQHAAFRKVLVEHGVSLISPETQERCILPGVHPRSVLRGRRHSFCGELAG